MAATYSTLTTKFPAFAGKDEAHVTAILALTLELLSASEWGTKLDSANEILAGHFLQLETLQAHGASGAVISRSLTKLDEDGNPQTETVAFAGGVASARKLATEEGLSQTVMGRLYLQFRDATIIPALSTGV